MMQVKLFEVRDRMTFIPVVAVLMDSTNDAEQYLLRRSGYEMPGKLVAVGRVDAAGTPFNYDPYAWPNRTMAQAHAYIQRKWDGLTTGDVIDVEHILGETPAPKVSERVTPAADLMAAIKASLDAKEVNRG